MIGRRLVPLATVASLWFLLWNPAHATTTRPTLIGWYTSAGTTTRGYHRLHTYSGEGMNLILPGFMQGASLDAFLRHAHKAHLSVIVRIDFDWVKNGNLKRIRHFVKSHQHSPAVYAWYLYDEPDFNSLRPGKLVAAYRAIKSVDRHPVAVVFMMDECQFGHQGLSAKYLRGFDLLMFDRYPFYTFTGRRAGLKEFHNVVRSCVAAAHHFRKLGPLMVEQGFGHLQDGQFMWRDPTHIELRSMFSDAMTDGALGVLYFYDSLADRSVRENVARVVRSWHTQQDRIIPAAKDTDRRRARVSRRTGHSR